MNRQIHHCKCLVALLYFFFCMNGAFSQNPEDTTDGLFHDDLLNHLVGKWDVSGVVRGNPFTWNMEAQWVMNHQYLRIDQKSREIVPWLNVRYEGVYFIGYNHSSKRYVVHEMSVKGDGDQTELPYYAYRSGNQLKLVEKWGPGSDTLTVQRFTWEPASGSWHIEGGLVIAGKKELPMSDMKLVAAKSSPK